MIHSNVKRTMFCAIWVVLLVIRSASAFSNDAYRTDDERAIEIMRGFLSSRQMIRQAEFTLTENVSFVKKDRKRSSVSSVIIDRDRGFVRIDAEVQATDGRKQGYQYILNDEYSAILVAGSRLLAVRNPGETAEEFGIDPPELSGVGLLTYHGLRTAPTEEALVDSYSAGSNAAVIQNGNELIVRWPLKPPEGVDESQLRALSEFTFRTDNGLRPIRYAVSNLAVGGIPLDDTVDTQWTYIDGIWVPTRCEMVTKHGQPVHAVYEYDWHSINKPLAAKQFRREGLDLPDGTMISDYRGGKPVIEEITGRTFGQYRDRSLDSGWTPLVKVAIALAVVACLGIFAVWRWKRRTA